MLKFIINTVFTSKNGVPCCRSFRNYGSLASVKAAFIEKFVVSKNELKPPYHHICQIGDPVLRIQAETVDPEVIPTAEFKKFVNHLVGVMKKYETFGLAASQIGLPVQVFAIETTEKNYKESIKMKCSGQPMEIVPLRVFINPKMKILDYNTFAYPECCASVCGYTADVPRAKSIRINALDLLGNPFVWEADGWPAKIAQHEMDHLRGEVFTDKMVPKTLSCILWDTVNRKQGKIGIDFYPTSKLKQFFYS